MARPDKPNMNLPVPTSSDYLLRLLDGLADVAYIGLDEHGVIRAWSGGARALYGYERAEVIGCSFAMLLSPRDVASARLLLKARNSDVSDSECLFRGRDGTDLHGRLSLRPVRDGENEIIGFAALCVDAGRNTPQKALDRAEQNFRLLVDSVIDYAIYTLDPKGIVTQWNAGAERIKGYKEAEIVGRHFSLFYTAEDRERALPQHALMEAATQGRFEAEGWRIRKDRSRFWASVVVDAIRNPQGELLGFAKVTRDITERRRAHEALVDTERQFRLLVQGVKDYALFRLDPNGIVNSWNSGAEKIKGYTADEIIGQHFSKFYTEAERHAGVPHRSLETARSAGKYEAEGWRVRRDGSLFYAHVVIDAIHDENGVLAGFAKITRDITEKREAEKTMQAAREQLAYAQKMEALGQLTGGVAHDFNNLLMIITGQALLAEKTLHDRERAVEALKAIRQTVRRGATLTRQMLSFSRRQNLNPQPIDLRTSISAFTSALGATLPPQVRLVLDVSDDVSGVIADSSELELALLNLIINARDAMPDGGIITVAARNGVVPAEQAINSVSGELVEISISDTGSGIPSDVMTRIFEPFFTTKPEGQGTGLGLSQVHGFAHQSGGTVIADSQLGSGTKISLYLPRVQREGAILAPASEDEAKKIAGRKVLLVEDNPEVARSTALMLEELGYQSKTVSNAAQALDALSTGAHFDLVFSDIVMPGDMDGIRLADELGKRRPHLPVLLTSGFSKASASVVPRYPLLRKPFELGELDAALARVLSKSVVVTEHSNLIPFDRKRSEREKDS